MQGGTIYEERRTKNFNKPPPWAVFGYGQKNGSFPPSKLWPLLTAFRLAAVLLCSLSGGVERIKMACWLQLRDTSLVFNLPIIIILNYFVRPVEVGVKIFSKHPGRVLPSKYSQWLSSWVLRYRHRRSSGTLVEDVSVDANNVSRPYLTFRVYSNFVFPSIVQCDSTVSWKLRALPFLRW